MGFRVGIDTGGTFTDLVALNEGNGEVRLAKVLSTPTQPAQALLDALAGADIALSDVTHLIHGTTVATNALLERKGARVAFVTTQGFEDVPFIQRIRREDEDAVLVRAGGTSGPAATFYVDWTTGLVGRVDSLTYAEGMGRIGQRVSFGDYREVSGVMIPYQTRIQLANPLIGEIVSTIEEVELGVALPEGLFELR